MGDRAHDVRVRDGVHFCWACGYRGTTAPPLPCPGPRDSETYEAFGVLRGKLDDIRAALTTPPGAAHAAPDERID